MDRIVNKKTAIVILGGGLKKEADGRWRTTNYDECDNFGVSGDRLRVVAAKYLYNKNPEQLIIVSGGKGQLKDIPDAPTVAEIIKKELTELGIPEEVIIKEEKSGNTFQQLEELKKIIKEKGLKNIGLLSNEWHLPRIKAMLEQLDELREISESATVEFLPAEEICLEYDKEAWQEMIEKARESEALKERIGREENGIEDIREGRYKIK